MLGKPPTIEAGISLPVRSGRWLSIAGALLSAAICFGFYLSTLAPGALGGDAGELQVVPYTLTLAHPTGYPLLTLLGKGWVTLFGFGAIAWRLNLLSAMAGALTVLLVYATVLALTRSVVGAVAAPCRWVCPQLCGARPCWPTSTFSTPSCLRPWFWPWSGIISVQRKEAL